MIDLLVLGEGNVDLVLSGGDVEPAFGQVEKLVERAQLTIGSSGAILACGAARLGLRTAFAGVVGTDAFGGFLLDRLGERGIDTDPVRRDATLATGITVHLVQAHDRGNPRAQAFCPTCGSPLYATSPGEGVQPLYMLRVGILRQRDQFTPKRQIWFRSARPWTAELDAVPKVEKQ